MTARPKEGTFRSEAWRRAVSSLPCVLCSQEGHTQAAHVNQGKGMGLKTHDCWTASLCVECHADIDQGAHRSKEDRQAIMRHACLLTIAELAKAGLVVPK